MTPKKWAYAGVALLFVISLVLHLPIVTLLIFIGMVIAVALGIARSLFRDIRGPDLTKPIGLFVLRALIPAGIALGLFLWANHIAEQIAPEVQMLGIEKSFSGSRGLSSSSRRVEDSVDTYQAIITILRISAWLAVSIALLRLYHLYRRLEAGQITAATVLHQLQTKIQPMTAAPVVPSAGEIESKLSTLKRMRDEGVISESEYDAKRTELIDRI